MPQEIDPTTSRSTGLKPDGAVASSYNHLMREFGMDLERELLDISNGDPDDGSLKKHR